MSSRAARRREAKASKTRAWRVEVTASEFNRFLYPYGTNVASKDVKEHLVSLRLVEKLMDPDITEEHPPTDDQIEEAEEKGEMVWATHTLAVDVHTFVFEEDEKRLALNRLEKNIGRVPPALGAEYEVLRQKFIEAESIDLTPEAVEENPPTAEQLEEVDRAPAEAEADLPT